MWKKGSPQEDGLYWCYREREGSMSVWERAGGMWSVMGGDYGKPEKGDVWWRIEIEVPLPPMEEQKRRLRTEGRVLGEHVTQGK
jgi:hypothetical protein